MLKGAPDLDVLLAPVRAAARELPPEAKPSLFAALAAVQAELFLPTSEPPPEPRNGDCALSPAEVGRAIGRSTDWVYRHRHELPATQLPAGRWVVRESQLRRWMEARSWRRA